MIVSFDLRAITAASILFASSAIAQEAASGEDKAQGAATAPAEDSDGSTTGATPPVDLPVDPVEQKRLADLEKIETAIAAYVEAFNSKDVDKVLSFWCSDGVYVSRTTGDRVVGHESLKKEFETILSGEETPSLSVVTDSIEFISPNVALERGTATVEGKDYVDQTTYQAVYVEQDGAWLIDRVTEDLVIKKASNYQHLAGLDFLVGEWMTEGEGMTVNIDCGWTTNQNYLSREYNVSVDGSIESSGIEIIGWDAKNKQIRSWLFDSNGGFIKGTWEQRDGKWVVQTVATLADGASGSSTNLIRPMDPDSYVWRKTNRVVDGKLLPNTEEVTLIRK